eukprot:TRINITY_DN25039_c0_g1_i1.p1 TRINITY_DN25039_c0_g1~~TRINITY_DN25039_c0_g1_i1.p1  ORF type:complete len:491 (+),score=156.96 TRINITY_DN25039_c0_g1_i1:56-1474(+)
MALAAMQRELADLMAEEMAEVRAVTARFPKAVFQEMFRYLPRWGLQRARAVCPDWREWVEEDAVLAQRLHEPIQTVLDLQEAMRTAQIDAEYRQVLGGLEITRLVTRQRDAHLPNVVLQRQAFKDGTTATQYIRVAGMDAAAVEGCDSDSLDDTSPRGSPRHELGWDRQGRAWPAAREEQAAQRHPLGVFGAVQSAADPGQAVVFDTSKSVFLHTVLGEIIIVKETLRSKGDRGVLATLHHGGSSVSVLNEPLPPAQREALMKAHAPDVGVLEELKDKCTHLWNGTRRPVPYVQDRTRRLLFNGKHIGSVAEEYVAARWCRDLLDALEVPAEGFNAFMALFESRGWPYLWPDVCLLEITDAVLREDAAAAVFAQLLREGEDSRYAPHSAKTFLLVLNHPAPLLAAELVRDGLATIISDAHHRAATDLRHHTAPFMVEQLGLAVFPDVAAARLEALFRQDDLLWQLADTVAAG